MGPIDGIVTVTITVTNAPTAQTNFGVPAFLCYHTHNTDYIRTYSTLAGLTGDSFGTTEPAYYWAQSVLAQTPTVPAFKIIRSQDSVQQTFTFTVTDSTAGDSVGFTVVGVNGVTKDVHRTNPGGETTTQIATAIAALTAPNGCTMASVNAVVTLTVTSSGKVVYPSAVTGGTYLDTTAAASHIATDLDNALGVDTQWYGITLDHQDATNIAALASAAESRKKLHCYTTADTANLSASSGIGNTLKTSAYAYSFGQYSGAPITYGASALEAQRFTSRPGSDTWAFKVLAGVAADVLTANQITNLQGNNLNYYTPIGGLNITQTGIDADGHYADLRRGIDALGAQIQLQVYALLVAQPKVPYDPLGIAMVGGEVSSALAQFTASPSQPAALLRGDPGFAPQVILPSIGSIPSTDRSARILKNVNFIAYAQNAVQTVQVNGIVNL